MAAAWMVFSGLAEVPGFLSDAPVAWLFTTNVLAAA